ncbi:Panacea domain-containing protein [Neorhizobium galegae]|uniref:type II toxin-antitoxin system antitoxin SocA domain-containing protein n=1 Tax=Neorhizobium galegae TaxID=399 RepID=UPI002101ADD6|nr:type II toxin-antitoxin system antitoxin SocA domain-containing protein [Neorhizobium galegae]MCQ1574074.1 Panacea domain-containing protein [Neorhizobium galegae]
MADRPYDKERLKHLIHYVIWKVGARAGFGATKLYKAAWFSDAKTFLLTGKSITGAPYIREKYGPIPKHGFPIRLELMQDGVISQWQLPGSDEWHFKALVPPAPEWFATDERKCIDHWSALIADKHTAASISDESHDYAWHIAPMGEVLPIYSILAERIRDPNDEELDRMRKKAEALGLH